MLTKINLTKPTKPLQLYTYENNRPGSYGAGTQKKR
jgi:hypothetical protein